MPTIQEIGRQLATRLKSYPADYIEVHLEESQSNSITYRGKELESVNKSAGIGGNVRALVKGGWGFVSFNDLSDLPGRIQMAIKQAQLIGEGHIHLASIPVASEVIKVEPRKNPTIVPLTNKKELLDKYNEIVWQAPGIQTSVVGWGDSLRQTIFINSEGSYIEQDKSGITIRVTAVAAAGGEVQQSGLSLGCDGDFNDMTNLHGKVDEIARKASEMLKAPHVKGGEYTVVLDPILAGVFCHEAFGHLSEADFVYENDRMREIMVLGKEFGSPILNIVDSAADPGLRGSYKYDDEGTPSTKTYLIKDGVLVGRLHSRETAAKMGEKPTGNARAINYRYPPIVRMTNTYIEPGAASFNDIIGDIKEGVYVKNWYGGTTSMEMFTFSAGEAYMIRDGKVAETMRPAVLTGNLFTTLKNIDAIGNDIDMNQGGGCGKGGQSPLPVSNGSPHIRIRHCLVGGK